MNPFEMMKNLQSLQSGMQEMQAKMADISVTGTAGGEMVRVTMNGQMTVTGVKIEPEAVDPDDIGMLEDLVRAATSDAIAKIKDAIQQEVSSMTGGMPIPPGFMGM
ncbi:YbaB/EbfC family nucleoid-associated protein [Marispirochaeta sp.]|jgi:nucleoid-associated protein EbfC|uniref:YbaB/EbfC family nucleoid-associated protein n=1 Tax=Marispirochaeta sp. TaxID=2038653 RepID=UPI0029C7D103|nr:YbaB/EbfC family nucleoid-associated protein [Marispirochaeta sp.]